MGIDNIAASVCGTRANGVAEPLIGSSKESCRSAQLCEDTDELRQAVSILIETDNTDSPIDRLGLRTSWEAFIEVTAAKVMRESENLSNEPGLQQRREFL